MLRSCPDRRHIGPLRFEASPGLLERRESLEIILIFDPALHPELSQERHHLPHGDPAKLGSSCPAMLRPSCTFPPRVRLLPRVTISRTAFERLLLCSFVSSCKNSKFSRSIRMLIVFVMSLPPVSAWRLQELTFCNAHALPAPQVSQGTRSP